MRDREATFDDEQISALRQAARSDPTNLAAAAASRLEQKKGRFELGEIGVPLIARNARKSLRRGFPFRPMLVWTNKGSFDFVRLCLTLLRMTE